MRSFALAREELLHLVRKPIMVAALVVMIVIPLLYGALYLWAFWDPYGALDRVPIALVNLDRAATTDGRTITAGSDLVDELIDARTFEWHVVSADEAARGVRAGTYYSSLTIPQEFSATLAAADSDDPQRAHLDVVLHESQNMIAAQIEGKVFDEVRKAASASASSGYFDTVLLGYKDVRIGLAEAAQGSARLADGVDSATKGSERLAAGTGDARRGGSALASGLGKLEAGAGALASGTKTASRGAGSVAQGASQLSNGVGSLAVGSDKIATGSAALAAGLGELERGTTSLSVSAAALAKGAEELDAGAAYALSGIESADQGAQQLAGEASRVRQLLTAFAEKYPDAAADPIFAEASATVGGVASGSASLASSLGRADRGLSGLSSGAHRVALGSGQLAAGAARIASGTADARIGASGLALGARTLASGATELEAGSARLAEGSGAAAAGIARLAVGSNALTGKLAEAEQGAQRLSSGLSTLDLGAIRLAGGMADAAEGSHELAEGLEGSIDDVPDHSDAGRTARAEMMSDPVALDETMLGEVNTYGTGFAPYFVPLALWVGMLIVFVILAPVPERAVRSGASAPVLVMTGMWPALAVGVGQSVLLYLVLRFGLGLEPVGPWATVGIIVLVSFVYAAIMQWLSVAFGPVGKLLGIVILMLQLTSAAGTFPLETLPGFFRAISPYMPMTHAVAALRESISGGDGLVAVREAWILALFGVAALVGSVFSARHAGSWDAKRLKPTIDL